MNVDYKNVDLSSLKLLNGKHILITGGTGGIGFATARACLDSGGIVTITSRSKNKADEAVNKLEENGRHTGSIFGVELDNRDVMSFEEKLPKLISNMGGLDILVNNAGALVWSKNRWIVSEYDNCMDVNLKGAYFLAQCASRYMIDNGVKGNICNVASTAALSPARGVYGMSKWAIRGMTEGFAKMLIPYGIVVNSVAPGPTFTEMVTNTDSKSYENEQIPAGRYVMPEEIANMIVILTSDIGRMIVGDTIYVSGGAGTLSDDYTSYNYVPGFIKE